MIREALASDDAQLGDLLVRAFQDQYARKMPEVKLTEARLAALRDVASKRAVAKVWIAEEAGAIVGTVAMWPPGAKGSEAWVPGAFDLRHLAVAETHRGKGVANALLDHAEAHARAVKAPGVCLHVRRGALGVAAVYANRGYERMPGGDLDKRPEVFLEAFFLRF